MSHCQDWAGISGIIIERFLRTPILIKMATENNSPKGYALITGGSAGIGYELAKCFAEDGYNLIIVSRTEEDLKQRASELTTQYKIQVTPIAKDLFQPNAAF